MILQYLTVNRYGICLIVFNRTDSCYSLLSHIPHLPSLQYWMELLQQSCMKPKLHPRPAPHAGDKSRRHNTLAEQFIVYWSEINLELFARVFHSTAARLKPKAAPNCCAISNGKCMASPTGATRTQHFHTRVGVGVGVSGASGESRQRAGAGHPILTGSDPGAPQLLFSCNFPLFWEVIRQQYPWTPWIHHSKSLGIGGSHVDPRIGCTHRASQWPGSARS